MFSPEWDLRLTKEFADKVIKEGIILGDGVHVKDCFWRCYEYQNRFFIGLNDENNLWETDEETCRDYAGTE